MKSSDRQGKRGRILEAAKSLFSRTHDVRRVSLEAIAKEAGVSPATIYNHFGNRETLVCEVIRGLVGGNIARNRALIRSDLPFPKKLMSILGGKLDMMERMNNEIIEKLISQDENIVKFIDEIVEREIKQLWKEMVADGKKQGYIAPALGEDVLLGYLNVLQAGFRAMPEFLHGLADKRDYIEQIVHLMCYGFLKKEIDFSRKEEKQSYD
ncbi:MAG: TetR/AcrR family transcriptional regulator [Dehalococcoidia bacterium]|jgi:AcrR family transcriptional regulator|nr:MAG: TetR/AcrR family transcriptional regulator [Dehalococcoidia bacterium]